MKIQHQPGLAYCVHPARYAVQNNIASKDTCKILSEYVSQSRDIDFLLSLLLMDDSLIHDVLQCLGYQIRIS